MIKIDCDDGIQLSDFDKADQSLIMMIALQVENAKDVFSQQNHVFGWIDDQYETLRLRDHDRGIECVYHIDTCDESITLQKLGGGRF